MRARLAAAVLLPALASLAFAAPAHADVDPEPIKRTFHGADYDPAVAETEAEVAMLLGAAREDEVCLETNRRVYQITITGHWFADIYADCFKRFTA